MATEQKLNLTMEQALEVLDRGVSLAPLTRQEHAICIETIAEIRKHLVAAKDQSPESDNNESEA